MNAANQETDCAPRTHAKPTLATLNISKLKLVVIEYRWRLLFTNSFTYMHDRFLCDLLIFFHCAASRKITVSQATTMTEMMDVKNMTLSSILIQHLSQEDKQRSRSVIKTLLIYKSKLYRLRTLGHQIVEPEKRGHAGEDSQ